MKHLVTLLLCVLPTLSLAQTSHKLDEHFASLHEHPSEMYDFLQAMPKGGELHMHFFGSGYAEYSIDYTTHPELCIDQTDYSIYIDAQCSQADQLRYAQSNPTLHNNLIDAWSMRNFISTDVPRHEHFFATFDRFFWVKEYYRTDILVEIMRRAARQNILYLELMTTAYVDQVADVANAAGIEPEDSFSVQIQKFYEAGLMDVVFTIFQHIQTSEALAREILKCDTIDAEAACDLTLRYKYLGLRRFEAHEVFAMLTTGFELARISREFVAVDIAQPEFEPIALRDFDLHMEQFRYLKYYFPYVFISMHAGEYTTDIIDPEGLNHIERSILQGQAQRIGHGVAIRHEANQQALLAHMAEHEIAVEINLTSNDEILEVKGTDSQFSVYEAHGVPMVLSTDDEGILRTALTREYLRAAMEHGASYSTLKALSRNSLQYSFLNGESLWADYQTLQPTPECAIDGQLPDEPSEACLAFLAQHDKARVQWALEQRFDVFEAPFTQ